MSSTTSVLPVGLRKGVVFEINASGRIEAQDDTLYYEGLSFQGPKAYALNIPEPRRIPHQGNDRLLAVDQLPSLDPIAGEIRVSALDFALDAFLMNQENFAVGDASMIARSTDLQGSERQVALLLYQQALIKSTQTRRWHFHIIPSSRVIPIPASFTENAEDHRYSLAPTPVKYHIWGTALSLLTEGVTEAGIFDGFTTNKPHLVAFKADGVEDVFVFNTAKQPVNANYSVWVDGVLQTAGITKNLTDVTFTVAPADGSDVIVFCEIENDPDE